MKNIYDITLALRRHSYVYGTILMLAILGGVIALQTYAQRGLQGRLRDASVYLINSTGSIGNTAQHEPYYLTSQYAVTRNESQIHLLDSNRRMKNASDDIGDQFSVGNTNVVRTRTRGVGGFQESTYGGGGYGGAASGGYGYAGSRGTVYEEQQYVAPNQKYYYMDYYDYPQATGSAGEEYASIDENYFVNARHNSLSTFLIDVDTAAYANVRRFLDNGQLPPVDAVRIEEMINYFQYDYPKPIWGQPFSIATKGAICPWNPDHLLVQIGLQGEVPTEKKQVPAHLVLLIDVSGSMADANKLPLLKEAFKMMAQQLRDDEWVSIVVYNESAKLWLDATPGSQKGTILNAIDSLYANGATSGEAGLRLAYRVARDNFIKKGSNRVVVATDGDFNVGATGDQELLSLIRQHRNESIFLSVLGFGTGNLKDGRLEMIADNGNGNYNYIDSIDEGHKVLVEELGSTLLTIAKDVKIQVEFNPEEVRAYKLIGYENRLLAKQDFNNDRVDAGELGAGHTVTALYEVVPETGRERMPGVDRLAYQRRGFLQNQDIMTVKLRYKDPNGSTSKLIKQTLQRNQVGSRFDDDAAFAAAVAEFGLLLRGSPVRGQASYQHVIDLAGYALGNDDSGHRREFIALVQRAAGLDYRPTPVAYYYPAYEPSMDERYAYSNPRRQFKGEDQ